MPCQKPLYRWVEQVVTRLPQPELPASHPGALQLRDHRGPAMRAQQRGHHPGRPDVGQVSHHPVAVAGVLSAGLGQVGLPIEANSTSPPASRRCWPGSSGAAGCRPAWRWPSTPPRWATASPCWRSASSIAARHPRGLKVLPGNVASPGSPSGSPCSASSPPGPARLGRAGDDRSRPHARWLYREIVAPGLAPADADHSPEQVPRGRLDVERGGHGAGPRRGPTLARAGAGVLPGPGGGWSARPGLLGAGARGGLVRADRPAPSRAEPPWYGMRGWIEHGFRLLKSDGWHGKRRG